MLHMKATVPRVKEVKSCAAYSRETQHMGNTTHSLLLTENGGKAIGAERWALRGSAEGKLTWAG